MTRSLVTRRTASAAAALLALALGGAGVAWACSPFQPHVGKAAGQADGLASGPAGTEFTMTGRDFNPGPVEVRWDSRTGQLLAEAVGPNFSVSVKIPDSATAGMHYIMAIPSTGSAGSMAFEVTRAPTASPEGAPAGAGSTTNGGTEDSNALNSRQQTADTDNSAATSGTSAGDSTSGQSDSGSTTAAAAGSGSTVSGATRAEAAQTATNVATTPAKAPGAMRGNVAERPDGAASANPALVTTPAGQAVFGGSTATLSTATPSAATVSGDTWSGFATDKPSLLSGGLGTSSSGPTSAPGVGIGLLGAGVAALVAGFAAAESSRKRALAGAQSHDEH